MRILKDISGEFSKYWLFRAITLLAIVLTGIFVPLAIDGSRVAGLIGTLIAVEGVVVTIFGIWIAIIFPAYVAGQGKNDGSEAREGARYRALLKSLYRSCFILCAGCICLLAVTFFVSYADFFSGAIFCFCALSLFSLFESLWTAVWVGDVSAASKLNVARKQGVLHRRRQRSE